MAELLARWLDDFLCWGEDEWDNAAYGFIFGVFGLAAFISSLQLIKAIVPAESSGWVEAIGVIATVVVTARLYFADVKRKRLEENAAQVSLIETVLTILHTASEGLKVMRTALEADRTGHHCPHNRVLLEPLAQIRQFPFATLKDGAVRQAVLLAQGTLSNLVSQFALDETLWVTYTPASKVTIVTALLDALIRLQPTLAENMRDAGMMLSVRQQMDFT